MENIYLRNLNLRFSIGRMMSRKLFNSSKHTPPCVMRALEPRQVLQLEHPNGKRKRIRIGQTTSGRENPPATTMIPIHFPQY